MTTRPFATKTVATLLTISGLVACQGSEATKRNNGDGSSAAGGANAAGAAPTATPEASPSPSTGPDTSASCEAQWQKHVAHFKVGGKLTYNATMTYTPILTKVAKTVPVSHSEEVTASSDGQVERVITLTSTDAEVSTLLNLFKLVPKVIVKKAEFLKMCVQAGDVAANTVAFSGGNAQVVENRDDTVTSLGQQVSARYLKLKGNITNVTIAGVTADIQVWLSKDVPGLVLKQTSVLSNVPLTGTVTFNDDLSSSTGM